MRRLKARGVSVSRVETGLDACARVRGRRRGSVEDGVRARDLAEEAHVETAWWL